jgi:hypothetical protein
MVPMVATSVDSFPSCSHILNVTYKREEMEEMEEMDSLPSAVEQYEQALYCPLGKGGLKRDEIEGVTYY